jgi:hypothetical protein
MEMKYWVKADEIIEAGEKIKRARMDNPKDPCLAEVSISCFGTTPTACLEAWCNKDGAMVHAGLSCFTDEADFVRAVGFTKTANMPQGGATLVVVQDDETEACLSTYRSPVSVTLPPRLPPTRPGHATQAAGVVEQYEQFIVVDGVCFSPICQWGHQGRPSGISAETLSNRCTQYFVIRFLNANVPPEELTLTCSQMLKDGRLWKLKSIPKLDSKVAKSFWPLKAAEVYETLHLPSV